MNSKEMLQFVTPDKDPRKNADHLFMYKGENCRQTVRVLISLENLNNELKLTSPVKNIIEIGTFRGAFTRVLRDHDISAEAEIFTFDIKTFPNQVQVDGVTHYIDDCFSAHAMQNIKNLINRPGRTILFCDGNAKEKEVNTFAPFLKQNDLIMCHDYVKDVGIMQYKEIVGNWPVDLPESFWKNIKGAIIDSGCEPFFELEMQRAMWGCFIKR